MLVLCMRSDNSVAAIIAILMDLHGSSYCEGLHGVINTKAGI